MQRFLVSEISSNKFDIYAEHSHLTSKNSSKLRIALLPFTRLETFAIFSDIVNSLRVLPFSPFLFLFPFFFHFYFISILFLLSTNSFQLIGLVWFTFDLRSIGRRRLTLTWMHHNQVDISHIYISQVEQIDLWPFYTDRFYTIRRFHSWHHPQSSYIAIETYNRTAIHCNAKNPKPTRLSRHAFPSSLFPLPLLPSILKWCIYALC